MRLNHPLGKMITVFAGALLITISGCSNYSGDETKLALIQQVKPKPTVFSGSSTEESKDLKMLKKVREEVLSNGKVYDAAIVKGEKDIVVAYKVKHLHRFRMKQIEKDINKHLEKKFPKENFYISSDYKIFLEVVELINDKKNPKYTDKKANKKLKEIIELKKELT